MKVRVFSLSTLFLILLMEEIRQYPQIFLMKREAEVIQKVINEHLYKTREIKSGIAAKFPDPSECNKNKLHTKYKAGK